MPPRQNVRPIPRTYANSDAVMQKISAASCVAARPMMTKFSVVAKTKPAHSPTCGLNNRRPRWYANRAVPIANTAEGNRAANSVTPNT